MRYIGLSNGDDQFEDIKYLFEEHCMIKLVSE